MQTVYAILHPLTEVVLHVGQTDRSPDETVRTRFRFHSELRAVLDALPDEPIVRTLEEIDGTAYAAALRRIAWAKKLTPPPIAYERPEPKPDPVRVEVPEFVITTAIRLRTDLLAYDVIAGRLTALGRPPGFVWTPGEVKHLIAQAFLR